VGIGTLAPDQGTEIHLENTDGNSRILIEGDNGAVLRFKKGNSTADISYDGSSITASNLSVAFDDGLNLPAGSAVKYNGLSGWRLVDTDYFQSGNDGWICVDNWNNNTARTLQRFTPIPRSVRSTYCARIRPETMF
jgi:hypothetical protein